MEYPYSRSSGDTDSLAGVTFPDPYRWLESDSEETRNWQHEQAELAADYVRNLPEFAEVRSEVERFYASRFGDVPRRGGNLWFRLSSVDGQAQPVVIASEEPAGAGRVVFDPVRHNPGAPPFVSWASPSPDGRTLAVGLCSDGSENNTIELVDVQTCDLLESPPVQVLMDNWTGGANWLPDSSGFFFTGLQGAPRDYRQEVFLHRRGTVVSTEKIIAPWCQLNRDYRFVVVSPCGNWATAFERRKNPIPVAIARLGGAEVLFKPFVTALTCTVAGHIIGNRFIAVTDLNAPRGRLIAIPLDTADANDPASWLELIPQSAAILRAVQPVAGSLYLTELENTYARVRVLDLDGIERQVVPLPEQGVVNERLIAPMNELLPSGERGSFIFTFSSLLQSQGIYRHTPGEEHVETIVSPKVRIEGAIVEDHWAESKDGTRIPYHLVRLAGTDPSVPQPTLIYAYGGYNLPFLPQFPGAAAAFVTCGGQFVCAHIRGGAEFGRDWWEGGRYTNKQNSYDDIYAIADQLIASGRTTPKTLALNGRSNGGLMCGVAMMQRPELWAAVIPVVPLLDCIGVCRHPYGLNAVMSELAKVDRPDEVVRLSNISPYHLIRPGVSYPPTFIDAGDADPRTPPGQIRKFAARLQQESGGDAPLLLHIWDNVGHGLVTTRDVAVLQYSGWLAFALHHTRKGITDPEEDR